jgi:rSAM/selenodomain-associated transferase 2/rSAM/selenodomain-associated transferase 1
MRQDSRISVVIPALNEANAIGRVLEAIPRWVDEVVVVDNGSIDRTAAVAAEHGARVVAEPRRGYGSACLAGIAALDAPDIVVFLDADFSDHPDEMARLIDPILEGRAELAIGSRVRGEREPGALTLQARFGNWLACWLMQLFWGVRHTDLGPFRAIRFTTLRRLHMDDRDFGWTVEMQVKAAALSIRVTEVPVSYRRRIGASKISGTVRGVILAGAKILYTIFRAALRPRWARGQGGRDALILFTRFPVAGQAKTRMIPALGPEGAARLHRRLAERAVAMAREACRKHDVLVTVWSTGGCRRDFRAWLGLDICFREQGSGDLGERMRDAIAQALAHGAARALVVGTDVPGICADTIRRAFSVLADHDVVLGLAGDGGYYLIGMKRCHPELFSGIDWGSERVAEQTRAAIRRLGLTVAELPVLDDVDRPEDLARLRHDPQFADVFIGKPLVSVIIPTLNEAEVLPTTLERLRGVEGIEIIVADGGSRDATREVARMGGAEVIEVAGGRAAQLNAAAARASGRYLLFLHADTLLPDGFADSVRQTLDNPATLAGAFAFRTDGPGRGMRLVEWGTNLRSSVFRWPYGDQGLFLDRRVFHELGGFADLPIMEDFDLVRRLRRRGRIVTLQDCVLTSARRWRRLGVLRTMLRNQAMILGYWIGVPPERLARFYRGADREKG